MDTHFLSICQFIHWSVHKLKNISQTCDFSIQVVLCTSLWCNFALLFKKNYCKKLFSGLVQGQKFNVSINIPQQLNIVWRVLSHIGLSSCVRSMNGGNDFSEHWSSDCGGITRSSKGQSRALNIRNFSGSSATPVTVRRSCSEEAAAGSLLWAAAISR